MELLNADYKVVAIDNFINSVHIGDAPCSIRAVEQFTGKKVDFYNCDLVADVDRLSEIFDKHDINCVIHFAAVKAVGESMLDPLMYYKNNVIATINLIEAMKSHDCYQLVFSSSCTVYGEPQFLPITESHPTGNISNVYGKTKHLIEQMLQDLSHAHKEWNIISLRYFNPVGAHPSGLIGEDPTKAFTNIMPYLAQVAMGAKPSFTVFGGDYDTEDGTGIRDYIHVMDLAEGHVSALHKLQREHLRVKFYNLGTGRGTSVLQLLKTFEKVTGKVVPYTVEPRREGDIVSMYANTDLARAELGWSAKYDVETMCKDFWRWQEQNPQGYKSHSLPSETNAPDAKKLKTNGYHSSTQPEIANTNGH